jgi:hypothetical protein
VNPRELSEIKQKIENLRREQVEMQGSLLMAN